MELRRRLQARMEELRRKRNADQMTAAKDWRKKQQQGQQGQGQGQQQGQHMTGERQRKKAEQKQKKQQQQQQQTSGKQGDGGEAAAAAAQVGCSMECSRESTSGACPRMPLLRFMFEVV